MIAAVGSRSLPDGRWEACEWLGGEAESVEERCRSGGRPEGRTAG